MTCFIAIDPGFSLSNGTGWCIVFGGKPVQLGLAVSPPGGTLAERCEHIRRQIPTEMAATGFTQPIKLRRVIEHMKVYPGPQQKGDQNDLINLAYLEGVLAAGGDTELVTARTWKGNVPKEIMQKRIEAWLIEIGCKHLLADLPKAKEKRGSVLEAAGIARWKLGGR